jgi:hypothetical protein
MIIPLVEQDTVSGNFDDAVVQPVVHYCTMPSWAIITPPPKGNFVPAPHVRAQQQSGVGPAVPAPRSLVARTVQPTGATRNMAAAVPGLRL